MQGTVSTEIRGKPEWFNIGPLELADLIIRRKGFNELDAEPTDSGRWKITARGLNRSVTSHGKDMDEAASKLVDAVW